MFLFKGTVSVNAKCMDIYWEESAPKNLKIFC